MKKKLTLIVNHPWDNVFFGKDVFLVPYYIGKIHNYDVKIVFPSNNLVEKTSWRDVEPYPILYKKKLTPFSFIFGLKLMWYLCLNAKRIDCFMRFHVTITTAIMIIIYKMLNRNGIAYLKVDNAGLIDFKYKKDVKSFIRSLLYKKMFSLVDNVSCETKLGLKMYTKETFGVDISSKLLYMPNGFDDEMRENLGIIVNESINKENTMLTVGRLGTEQKNTKLLLDALNGLDLKDWKIYLIGPIDDYFKPTINVFFENNPQLENKVIFPGNINSKKELWEYYNKSKVFLLTSRREGYPIVFGEALRFHNYIVSSELPSSIEIISKWGGKLFMQEDVKALHDILLSIIEGDLDLNIYDDIDVSSECWCNIISKMPF